MALIDFNNRARAATDYSRTTSMRPVSGQLGGQIGPWHIVERSDGFFEWRVDAQISNVDLARFCTRTGNILPKSESSYRVILIGESAAGSFGYWDEYTLATILEKRLSCIDSKRRVEVIDLSCVNATWLDCNHHLNHCATLNPDLVVFLVGNNEVKALLPNLEHGTALVDEEGFRARWSIYESTGTANQQLGRALSQHCISSLDETFRIANDYGIELLYVIPEFNWVDWQPLEGYSFNATEIDVSEHIGNQRAVNDAHPNQQRLAWERVKQGGNSISAAAIEKLRGLPQIGLGSYWNGVPQMPTQVADDLVSFCRARGHNFLDLREEFDGVAGRPAPDRSVFIDYCHYSADGLNAVAARIARHIAERSGGTLYADNARTVAASPLDLFQGAIVGMLHNYHYGQPESHVRYWLDSALLSRFEGASEFLGNLGSLLVNRGRILISPAQLAKLRLTNETWDPRFNLYVTKFVYHARYDTALAKLIHRVLGLDEKAIKPVDESLKRLGEVYSLYYLDLGRGVRPLARQASRNGWERPDLSMVLDAETAVIELPNIAGAFTLNFEIEVPDALSLSIFSNDAQAKFFKLARGRNHVSIACSSSGSADAMNSIVFKLVPSRMFGIASKPTASERYLWALRYGIYPIWGRLENMSVTYH